jgi:LDH2 family malate/lactate/ureidoglycolate dehydrogenase
LSSEIRIPRLLLEPAVAEIFERCGMSPEDAALVAATLLWADLRGVHSHGVLRVPEYVRKLRERGVNPTGRPRVVKEAEAAILVDGGNSMGQVAATFAMGQAIERARRANVAVAAVRGSNHCGALGYYAALALPEEMIGLATTNALPTMAPWRGKDKIVGINPLAVAIPAAAEPPIVLDCAFSHSSHGKIRVFHQKGWPIPQDWALDPDGRPTTDPAAGINGLLQPIGGYKGVGLAIVMGILSSVLSGASYGTELGNMIDGARPGQDGHFFLALRIAAFEDPGVFQKRVDTIIRQIAASRPAAPGAKLYAPGGLEAEIEERYRAEGIPLNAETLAGFEAAADGLGVPCPWTRAHP